ncbi:MAG: division/cell wall cluster transcriptional repressor MraZ [Ottowia sp.]|nr:division/cell wall cluster transcriptional repressor MraZ [Ottowia sp.]
MFQGASALSLDTKGRMSIPARYRDALLSQSQACVTLTKHPDGCLLLFPQSEWEVFREKISSLPMNAHWWRRIFLGNAAEVDIDGASRVLIAPELRVAAALEKEVMLLGMGSHFEIWDAATYAAKEQSAMADGLPDALKNFSF